MIFRLMACVHTGYLYFVHLSGRKPLKVKLCFCFCFYLITQPRNEVEIADLITLLHTLFTKI